MRLPTKESESDIDEPAAVEMMRYAFDRGVNYVDTAYPYHGGRSEVVVGKALAGPYRDRVLLATKLPVWKVEKLEDCDRLFDEQLARLETDHVDFYLLHCLQAKSWPKMRELGVLGWAEKLLADGRIGHFGFSFHDNYRAFVEIVDSYDWSFCQIQYNLANEQVQAGTKGLKYAAARGLGVIVMEPLFGGTLVNPPEPIQEIWNAAAARPRPADVALRWVWNKPEVSLVLSGMSALEQVEQNLQSACRSGVGELTGDEARLVARVQQAYRELSPVPCTRCGYCMPCPNGVDIPGNFEVYNSATVFKGNSVQLCRNLYQGQPAAARAEACRECAVCEEKCPQQIPIVETLGRVAEFFGHKPAK